MKRPERLGVFVKNRYVYDADDVDQWLTKEMLPLLQEAKARLRKHIEAWFDGLEPGLDATFYHTLTYQEDIIEGSKMEEKAKDIDTAIQQITGKV